MMFSAERYKFNSCGAEEPTIPGLKWMMWLGFLRPNSKLQETLILHSEDNIHLHKLPCLKKIKMCENINVCVCPYMCGVCVTYVTLSLSCGNVTEFFFLSGCSLLS